MFELVTGTEMKPWLSRNMLPKINTCENGWSNFSANIRVMSLKLLELAQFAWPNLWIYFNFLCAVPRDDVIESNHFLMRSPVIPPWLGPAISASFWTLFLDGQFLVFSSLFAFFYVCLLLVHSLSFLSTPRGQWMDCRCRFVIILKIVI